MVFGRLWKAVSVGMMLGGMLLLAACPGDLENAQDSATKEDKKVENKQTKDECLDECQATAEKQEAECVAKLTDEEKKQTSGYDSPVLACKNDAMGDLMGCQVECAAKARKK